MPKGQHCWYKPEEKIEIIQKYLESKMTVEKICNTVGISNPYALAFV